MIQNQEQKHPHQHPHAAPQGAGLDVAKLREKAQMAAKGAMEEITQAEAEAEALRLKKEAEEAARHELQHIREAENQEEPVRMCLRRARFSPQERRIMHGGCGGL